MTRSPTFARSYGAASKRARRAVAHSVGGLLLAAACGGLLINGCAKKEADQGAGQAKGKAKVFVMVPKGVHPYYEPCYEASRMPPPSTA